MHTKNQADYQAGTRNAAHAGHALAAMLLALASGTAAAVGDLPGGPAVLQMNLGVPATRIASEQIWLHWFLLVVCSVIFVGVFGVMFYSILKHRKSLGHKAQELKEPLWVEIGWTLVPFLIVIGMALPATKLMVALKDTTNSDLTIKVTGYQWKWGYDYLRGEGEGLKFISTLDTTQRQLSNNGSFKAQRPNDYLLKVDQPLVVPVNKKVRIITTANDVIHSFMVPAFGIKQDAIPGFVRDTWFRAEKTGDYYGQCAELCGKEHAYMPIHVKVLSQADYTAWVEREQKKAAALADDPSKVWQMGDLMVRGEKVYANNCALCHLATGKGAGTIKPLDGSAKVLSCKAEQMHVLLEGQNNGAMPSWKHLSDTDLAAVVTFTKNHWTNKTEQMVQPAEFVAARAGNFPACADAPASGVASAASPASSASAP